MMSAVRTIATVVFALAAGCAGVKESPPSTLGQTGPLVVDPSLVEPERSGPVGRKPGGPIESKPGGLTESAPGGPIEPERGAPVAPERP